MIARRLTNAALAALLLIPVLPAPARAAEQLVVPIPGLEIDGVPLTITLPAGVDPATLTQLGFDPSSLANAAGVIVKWRGGKGNSARRMALVRKALGDPGVKWARRLAAGKADVYRLPESADPAEFKLRLQQLVDAAFAFTTPPGADPASVTLEQQAAELARRGIAWVELDSYASLESEDPLFSRQWDLAPSPGIDLAAAASRSTGAGVRVAVIDTGITAHPDLAGRILPGYDFVSDPAISHDNYPPRTLYSRDSDPSDPGDAVLPEADGKISIELPFLCVLSGRKHPSWHGTHVAGTIAARRNNGLGIAGIAPDAQIVPVRVLGRCGGSESDIADGITWASGGLVPGAPRNRYPAKILSMSLGGKSECKRATQSAIDGALARGASVVVAAGNSSEDARAHSPANCRGVIVVGSYGPTGKTSSFSNVGPLISVWAPGEEIVSTWNLGEPGPGLPGYTSKDGTSMATPHVSAAIALLFAAARRSLSPGEVRTAIRALPAPCLFGVCAAPHLDVGQLLAGYPLLASPTPARTASPSPGWTPSPSPSPTHTAAPTPTPAALPDRPSGGAWRSPAGTTVSFRDGGQALGLAAPASKSYLVSWSAVEGADYFFLKGYYAPNPKGSYAQGARLADCPSDLGAYATTEFTGQSRSSGTSGDIGPLSSGSHCTIVRVRAYKAGLGTYTLGVSPIIFVGP